MHDGKLPYDCIVWEKVPHAADKKYTHIALDDLHYDFGVAGKIAALSKKYEHILVIVETLDVSYLVPWLSTTDAAITVLQLNAGVSGYMTKSQPDIMDIATIMPYANVREVYDRDSLLEALQADGKNYIRITFGDTQTTLFTEKTPEESGVVDLREQGFNGGNATIIAPGGTLISAIHAVQQLQDEGNLCDLFVLTHYDFAIGKALKESIIKTEKVIVLLDQQRRTQYEAIVKAKLWDAGLVDTQIHFVYPNSEKINTILPEYLWEQAQWDGPSIAEKISSLS